MKTYLVGSRASNLAKAQVREYLAPLCKRFPDITFTHRVILEGGDKDRKVPAFRCFGDQWWQRIQL